MSFQVLNIIFGLAIFFFTQASRAQGFSFRNLNTCNQDYSEVLMEEELKKIEELPQGIYLVRSITQSLESQNDRYISYQRLTSPSERKPDICFTGEPSSAVKTQSLIPMVIDRSPTGHLGNTFWSLSAALDKATGAVNFTRSLIHNSDYKKALSARGFKITSLQKSHDVFKLRLERVISSWKEVVVIHYDQF